MARELPEEDRARFEFVAGDIEPNEEYLDSTRPEGYTPARARSLPYRYEEWGRLSSLLAVSQEIVARIEQLRAARPDTQIALDDIALARNKPDGLGYMTAYVEQCLMDISTHCSAIGLLANHPYSVTTRTTDPAARVYGTSSAIAVHQRAIIESAAALLSVVNPPEAEERYMRLVQEIRDEMAEWDRHLMAEKYDTVLPMADLVGRVVSRYALEFKSKGARNQAVNNAKTKKSRTQMIKDTLGDEIFWVWKRTTMDSHGSALLSQVLLAEDSPFLSHADARFRANGIFAAVRAVLDRLKVVLETSVSAQP